MNGSDSLDAPLFLQSDEERLRAEIAQRWARAAISAGPYPVRPVATPQNAWERVSTPDGEYWGPPLLGKPPEPKTRAERVLAVLSDGLWHFGHELTGPNVGGSEGLRRLRELRKDWNIEMRQAQGRASREYKLTGKKERGA